MTASETEPRIVVRLRRDGTGEVLDGHTTVQSIITNSLPSARTVALDEVRRLATNAGGSVRFKSVDPAGEFDLMMDMAGQVTEFQPEPIARPEAPGQDLERAYDSRHVIDTLIPATQTVRSTRGWRGKLNMRPSARERAELDDRTAICQSFGRPVTIAVVNPRGGAGATVSSLLLAGAYGAGRGGGVIAIENQRGTMHLRTFTETTSTSTDLVAARRAWAETRLGDLSAYARHQPAGQFDALVAAKRSDRGVRSEEFAELHDLAARYYGVIVVDVAPSEATEGWQAAVDQADAIVVPLKWRYDYSLPAIEMLEELEHSGDPHMRDLVRRAVIVASHGQGELDPRCRKQLLPYLAQRTKAIIEIAPDRHIAAGGVIHHDQLRAATRRQAERIAAEASLSIREASDGMSPSAIAINGGGNQ